MNRPTIFWEQLPIGFKPSIGIPVLRLQDQATRSGRTASIFDGSHVLAGKHQRLVNAGREVREGVRSREGLTSSASSSRSGKSVYYKGYLSNESHPGDAVNGQGLHSVDRSTATSSGDPTCRFLLYVCRNEVLPYARLQLRYPHCHWSQPAARFGDIYLLLQRS